MHAECPLCGRQMKQYLWDSFHSAYPKEIVYQIRNLEKVQRGLTSGKECASLISAERYEMCPLCLEIIDGITSDAKRNELIARIAKAIVKLEKRRKQLLPGHA